MLADHVFYAEASIFLASVATGDAFAADEYFDAAMESYSTNTALQNRCMVTLSNWDAPCALAMLMLVQGSGDYTSWFAIQLARQYTDAYVGTEDSSLRRMTGRGDITCAFTCTAICSCGLGSIQTARSTLISITGIQDNP